MRELRGILDMMATIGADSDNIDFDILAELDVRFHLTIAAAVGNRFLRQTSGVLHEILRSGIETTLAIPGRAQASREDHERIYTALVDGNPPAARKAARAHIRAAHTAARLRNATAIGA